MGAYARGSAWAVYGPPAEAPTPHPEISFLGAARANYATFNAVAGSLYYAARPLRGGGFAVRVPGAGPAMSAYGPRYVPASYPTASSGAAAVALHIAATRAPA